MDIGTLLKDAIKRGASDVHLLSGGPVMMRVMGELMPMPGLAVLDPKACTAMIYQLLSEPQRATFDKLWTVNSSFELGSERFRVNVAIQRKGIEAVFRVIPTRIPTPADLMLPQPIVKLAELKQGLILVTGPTGSGKSTTLASLLELINQTRAAKIITIEDPIEFIHNSKKSYISQREIGQHAPNFQLALKDILRQDPDVVLVGEMTNYETMAAAMQVADTGHVVFATLHSADAPQAVERIVDVFPGNEQPQVRAQLAAILRSVIAQTLLPRLDGRGRVAAFEIMMITPAVANMIRQGRTHEIDSAIEMGATDGMKSMERSLQDLARQGIIDSSFAPPGPQAPPPNRPGK